MRKMKKIMTTILAVAMVTSMSSPVLAASKSNSNLEMKVLTKLATGNSAGISNPFTDCKTLKEAQKLADFKITLPKKLPSKFSEKFFRVIKEEMIEVIYQNETDKLTIRKAIGTEDISGVYTKYSENNTIVINKTEVTIKGEDGKISVAAWTDGTYSYAVYSKVGISKNWIKKLVKSIQ